MASRDRAFEIICWDTSSVLRYTCRKFNFHSSQNMKAIWQLIGESLQSLVEAFQGGTAKEAIETAVIKE